jgi:DNA-directed RNA polymerase specialized sigma24 family protein
MEKRPVVLDGTHLGDVKLVERKDWKNRDRAPTPLDFEQARVALSAQAVYEILERYPEPPSPDVDEAWILKVVRAVGRAAKGRPDAHYEEDVLRRYMDQYGMAQIVRMFGGDVDRIRQELDRMRSEEG